MLRASGEASGIQAGEKGRGSGSRWEAAEGGGGSQRAEGLGRSGVTDIARDIRIDAVNRYKEVAFAHFERSESLPGGSGMIG